VKRSGWIWKLTLVNRKILKYLLIIGLSFCLLSCKGEGNDCDDGKPCDIEQCGYKIIAYSSDQFRDSIKVLLDRTEEYLENELVGFYFKPVEHELIDGKYKLRMIAAFRKQISEEDSRQVLGDSLELDHTAHSPGVLSIYSALGGYGYLFEFLNASTNDGFYACQLEFFDGGFENSYISYEDLKLILEYSRFIGISGSQITEGEIRVIHQSNRLVSLPGERESHFTLKFDGFTDSELELPDWIPNKNGTFQVLNRAVNAFAKPTTNFAAPCPPRWDEW
jgi:hypothetical protein